MAVETLGSIIIQGNYLRINNARVDEVSISGTNTGFILISYGVYRQDGIISAEQLRLNVGSQTLILDSFGFPICLCDLRSGMRVDVTFSPAMTRSIPPQSTAFRVQVR